LLATLHRPYNTDLSDNLHEILEAFLDVGEMIVFPVHPRARITIMKLYHPFLTKLKASPVRLINIVGYHDMLIMEQNARLILTDSAGMQREAFFFAFPCVTL
jgi:UDP-N-acetylglucosamine 2-epimerase